MTGLDLDPWGSDALPRMDRSGVRERSPRPWTFMLRMSTGASRLPRVDGAQYSVHRQEHCMRMRVQHITQERNGPYDQVYAAVNTCAAVVNCVWSPSALWKTHFRSLTSSPVHDLNIWKYWVAPLLIYSGRMLCASALSFSQLRHWPIWVRWMPPGASCRMFQEKHEHCCVYVGSGSPWS